MITYFETEDVTTPSAVNKFASESDGSGLHPYSKMVWGADGFFNLVANAAGSRLPVQVAQGLSSVGVVAGQVELSGVVAALPTVAARRFKLKAENLNDQTIFIGPAGTTAANGFPLSPGDEMELEVSNLDVVFAIVASGTQKLHYFGHI